MLGYEIIASSSMGKIHRRRASLPSSSFSLFLILRLQFQSISFAFNAFYCILHIPIYPFDCRLSGNCDICYKICSATQNRRALSWARYIIIKTNSVHTHYLLLKCNFISFFLLAFFAMPLMVQGIVIYAHAQTEHWVNKKLHNLNFEF